MANPVAYARVHDAAHPSYYDVVLPDSQEAEMWAYDLLPLYSGATVAALQARIAELEGLINDPVSGWKALANSAIDKRDEWKQRAEAAEARNAASERDAGRYAWLMANAAEITFGSFAEGYAYYSASDDEDRRERFVAELDAAIDAHTQGQAGEEKDG